jgi:transposase
MAEGRREERRKEEVRNDIILILQTSDFKLMKNLAKIGYKLVYQLLPGKALFQLESCEFNEITHQITLIAASTKTVAQCPLCQELNHRIHSRYERKLTDLPWANYSVTLELRVRKFFCINALCKRRIFTERLGGVSAPWARKTLRLTEKLTAIGLALGGNAGVRLSHRVSAFNFVSKNTDYFRKICSEESNLSIKYVK